MPELHLKSQHLLIVLVSHLLNIVNEFKNLEETGNWKQFKIFKDRVYEIARNCKYDGYQRALESMVSKFFNKKTGSVVSVNEE